MNYCQDGVFAYTEDPGCSLGNCDVYDYAKGVYGHFSYEKEVNGKPFFKGEQFGIYFASVYWLIGPHSMTGNVNGYGYYMIDVPCPNLLVPPLVDWRLLNINGWYIYRSIRFLTTCKYNIIKSTVHLLTSKVISIIYFFFLCRVGGS